MDVFRVLLIEDDETAAMLVGGALQLAGAVVDRVRDHAAGAEKFAQTYYDVVVSDLLTPRGQVETFVRTAAASASPPRIVLMSALSGSALDNLAESHGAVAVHKPIDVRELLEAVLGRSAVSIAA